MSEEGSKAERTGKGESDDKSHQDRFWMDFTEQAGVRRDSLAGQCPASVQRKLVRLSGSYDDARECWNRWVKPSLEAAKAEIATSETSDAPDMDWALSPFSCSVSNANALDVDTQEVRHARFTYLCLGSSMPSNPRPYVSLCAPLLYCSRADYCCLGDAGLVRG